MNDGPEFSAPLQHAGDVTSLFRAIIVILAATYGAAIVSGCTGGSSSTGGAAGSPAGGTAGVAGTTGANVSGTAGLANTAGGAGGAFGSGAGGTSGSAAVAGATATGGVGGMASPEGAAGAPTCTGSGLVGFALDGATARTGVVTGKASGAEVVVGAGTFAGAFIQNASNLAATESISTDCSANITSPGTQGSTSTVAQLSIADGKAPLTATSFDQATIAFSHGTLQNSGAISNANAALGASDVVEPFDPYPDQGLQTTAPPGSAVKEYWGDAVVANSESGAAALTNGSASNNTAIISSLVSGSGAGNAVGFKVLPWTNQWGGKVSVANYGTISGEYSAGSTGAAAAIWARANGGQTITNYKTGTLTAKATYYASAIYSEAYFSNVGITADGTVSATATGATQGNAKGFGVAVGIDAFTYSGSITTKTLGTVSATAAGTTDVASYALFLWAEQGDMTYTNEGTITATAAKVGQSKTLYCGGNGNGSSKRTLTLINHGTVRGMGGGGGWAFGVENDNGNGDKIVLENSGTISHDSGLGVFVFCQAPGAIVTVTNTGSIFGSAEGIAAENCKSDMTLNISGNVVAGADTNNALSLGTGNDTVNITGLPTITGVMNGRDGNNTLNFAITGGKLETVNDAAANKGTALSAYGLGNSGKIVVSGKTYQWENFTVAGSVMP